jgi:hypothetical protein
MSRSRLVWVWLLASAACGGAEFDSGAEEPLVLHASSTSTLAGVPAPLVFVEGALPGTPPRAPAGPDEPLRVTAVENASGLAIVGEVGKTLSGRVSREAVAVGIALAGQTDGHWVVPVGAPDPTNNGEYLWNVSFEVTAAAATGPSKLRVVAIGANGVAGVQTESDLCVVPAVPDNFNACDPTIPPPAAVISLAWDTAADLDLVVTTPSGRIVSPKAPGTAPKGATTAEVNAGGRIDLDAQAGCRFFGRRRENLVFQKPPEPGVYNFYVNVFDACGASSARYSVGVYTPEATSPTTSHVVERQLVRGFVLGASANGGAGKAPGLYVGSFTF